MTLDEFLDQLEGVKPAGNGFVGFCPGHDDDGEPSLGVTADDERLLLRCYAGCTNESIVKAMGLELRDLFVKPRGKGRGTPEAIYSYTDEQGEILFEAVRYPGKKFWQRHYDPDHVDAKEDGYVYSLEGVRRVLYHLPDIIASPPGTVVYLTEGEKDADRMRELGFVASCNPMGAGKWRPEYNAFLAGKKVIVIQDRDESGRNHSAKVKESLEGGLDPAKRPEGVWVVQAKVGKDVSDHLASGLEIKDLIEVRERVKRGIITARELVADGFLYMKSKPEDIIEYGITQFGEKHPIPLRPGRMATLAGYTGDGKTVTQLQITRELCASGSKVIIFSLEMSADDLRNRLVSQRGIPLYKVERPWLCTPAEMLLYKEALDEIAEWDLEIVFKSNIDAEEIRETTIDREAGFVVVDHIHRMNWGQERRKLETEINGMTNLALDYNIPVLLIAQLRKTERGKGFATYPKPTLQDFRETSMLADDAALALAIWRARSEDGMGYHETNLSHLIVLKNRYGAPAAGHEWLLTFNNLTGTFDSGGPNHGSQTPEPHPAHYGGIRPDEAPGGAGGMPGVPDWFGEA